MNAFLIPTLVCLLQFGPAKGGPRIDGKLHAAHDAVAPGGTTELALELDISKPWHLYHPILLGPGLPTEVTFDAPPGVIVGPVRYPVPMLGKALDQEFLGFEHHAVLIAPLHVEETVAAGTSITVSARMSGLACTDKNCVPVEASATFDLPVRTDGKPANAELFEQARAALAKPFEQAPYIEGSHVELSHDKVPIKGRAEVDFVIDIKPKHHIQAPNPKQEGFIGARLFIESVDGIEFDPPMWPKAHVRNDPYLGELREYAGQVRVRARFSVTDANFPIGPASMRFLFQYQCCTDDGQCYPPEMAEGTIAFEVVPEGTAVTQTRQLPPLETDSAATAGGATSQDPLWLVFVFAFIGGAILNIMPCVLPVISLKILGFVRQAGESRARVMNMGLVYAVGILASFAVLAAIMVGLGTAWGGLMQYPAFVIGASAVVLALALSLLGVFEIQLPGVAMNAAASAGEREGYAGAFFNGVLATALATPCTAPFLGGALGVLAKLSPGVMAAGIMTVGLGLAAPYVLLSAVPAWLRFLPKPGPWMITFKQVMGFVLIAALVWLLSILIELVSPDDFAAALTFLAAVSFGAWLLGRLTLSDSSAKHLTIWMAVVAILCCGWFGGNAVFGSWKKIPWQPWAPGLPEQLAADGYTVYVDYTAVWCTTCQTNKRVALETDAVRSKLKDLQVVPIKADFTRRDAAIQEDLARYDRIGVPLNIVLPAGRPDEPIVLPEILTPGIVLDALEQAGPSTQPPKLASK